MVFLIAAFTFLMVLALLSEFWFAGLFCGVVALILFRVLGDVA